MSRTVDGRNQLLSVELTTGVVTIVFSYAEGAPERTLGFLLESEVVEQGRRLVSDAEPPLLEALRQDHESGRSPGDDPSCQLYAVTLAFNTDAATAVLCDDTMYAAPSEALRSFTLPYFEEIPPPPPM